MVKIFVPRRTSRRSRSPGTCLPRWPGASSGYTIAGVASLLALVPSTASIPCWNFHLVLGHADREIPGRLGLLPLLGVAQELAAAVQRSRHDVGVLPLAHEHRVDGGAGRRPVGVEERRPLGDAPALGAA